MITMIEQLILDVKGVLFNETKDGKVPTDRGIEFIWFLGQENIPYLLGTNITSELPKDVLEELVEMGYPVTYDRLVSPIDLSMDYLRERGAKKIFLITDNNALRELYYNEGFAVSSYDDNTLCDAVVAALDKSLGRQTIDMAVMQIANGAIPIALHRNMTRVSKNGEVQPSVGTLVKELEELSGDYSTLNMGKPSETFYLNAMNKLPSQEPSVTLVVGDDPIGDLSGAVALGMQTAFMRSKKYQEWPADVGFRPDYEIAKLPDLIPMLKKR